MAREINRLNARMVATLSKPGRYADGRGLYLRVTPTQKSWTFMFKWRGKMTETGLGPLSRVSLANARKKAEDARRRLEEGLHPAKEVQDDHAPSFGKFADEYIALHEPSWRNDKHRAQWKMTLGRTRDADGKLTKTGYCLSLAKKPVDEITVEDVLTELKPIWHTKPTTASRIRGRIEMVLDAAKARGHRTGENPAVWRGNLALILPKRSKVGGSKNFSAMPHSDVPAFVSRLRESNGAGALALEFLILTAARSGEVRGATWSEIDLDNRLWTVPSERMKTGKEHRVPLCVRAIEILEVAKLLPQRETSFIFPGIKRGKHLNDMTLTACLRRLGHGDVTAHGFRSSFRDWAGDCTHYARELIEQALAHVVGGVEGAYRRSDALEKRRALMDDWASFIEARPADPGKVVPLRKAQANG